MELHLLDAHATAYRWIEVLSRYYLPYHKVLQLISRKPWQLRGWLGIWELQTRGY